MKPYMFLPLLLLASFAAQATGGTVRFSGSVVEPLCSIGQARDAAREILLEGCPLSAEGARLQVVPIEAAAPAKLAGSVAGSGAAELDVLAQEFASNALSFSSRYSLVAADNRSPAAGSYLIIVEYP